MIQDRRSEERKNMSLPVRWEGLTGTYEAQLQDISLWGCFVNTSEPVELKEILSLEIRLPSAQWLLLRGEVTSRKPGNGFGLLFSFLTDEEEEALRNLLAD
jgi:hypothetical protein